MIIQLYQLTEALECESRGLKEDAFGNALERSNRKDVSAVI